MYNLINYTKIADELSERIPTMKGIQGDFLSPVSFKVGMNEIIKDIKNIKRFSIPKISFIIFTKI